MFIKFENCDKACSKMEKKLVYFSSLSGKTYERSGSGLLEVFCKKGVLKFCAKFAEKHPRWSFYLTVTGLSCFRVNFAECLRTPNL